MAFTEFDGELDKPASGTFVEFDGELDRDPKQPLPAGVKESTAGAGRGSMADNTPPKPDKPADARALRDPHLGMSTERAAAARARAADAEEARKQDPNYSVLDTPAITQPNETLSGRMTDAEYAANYSSNTKPKPEVRTHDSSRDSIKNTPGPVVAGAAVRRALGTGLPAVAVEGVMGGLSGIAKVVPGLVAGAADVADKVGIPGAEAVRDFSLGQARTADQFGEAVQGNGTGGYYEKLVGNVFASVAQNLPVMAMGMGGAAEMVAGKVVADQAAKTAMNQAMKTLFVQTAGAEYADARNLGFDPAESAARAGIFGAAEVLGERFGFHEQMAVLRASLGKKKLDSHQLSRVLATEVMKEIPGEELTTAIEFLADKYGPAAKSPKATLADYLEQAADTAAQTIGQTLLMGAPASLRNTYQRADAAAAYDSAKLAGLNVNPPFNTDTPDVQRKKTIGIFSAIAAQYGMDPDAVKRATEAAGSMPAADVGPFLARLTTALQKRQLVAKPPEEHAIDALVAGPIDDPKVVDKMAADAEKEAEEKAKAKSERAPTVSHETSGPEEDLSGLSEPAKPLAKPGTYHVPDSIGPDGPEAETVKLIVKPNGDAAIQRGNGDVIDVSNMVKAGYSAERAIAQSIGHDTTGTKVKADSAIDKAATEGATHPSNELPEPTQAQKEAENYKVGHDNETIPGERLSIENGAGSTRKGVSPEGKAWETAMQDHYGRILGTVGMDSTADKPQHVDFFAKAGTPAQHRGPVFIVDQVDPKTGKPDEHKVMFGYDSLEQARAAYLAHYEKGWKGLGAITETTLDDFKTWVHSDATSRPYGPAQPDVQPATKQPARGRADGRADAAGSGRTVGQLAPDAGQQRATPAAAPVASGAAPEPAGARGGQPGSVARVFARAGRAPASAPALELRPTAAGQEVWHDGHQVLDFESGDPVVLPADVTDEDALAAVKASGAFSKSTKYFAPKGNAEAAPAAPAPKPKASTPGTATSDAFLARKQAEKDAAAAVPAPVPDRDTQDRQGLRQEDRDARKLDSNASELAGQMADDVTGDDFDAAEVMPGLEKWAKDSGLAADDLRQAVLKQLKGMDLTKAQLKKLTDAMDPIKAAAKKPRALPDRQAFARDYAAFAGRDLQITVQLSDTGSEGTLTIPAQQAMRSLDARLKALTELRACIGRSA